MALYRLWFSRTENNLQHSPGPDLPADATPRKCSVLGGPSSRRGNASGFRRTFEAQGLGAHVAKRARTAAPHLRSAPSTSTQSFLSRRHKSRGDPRSRTGLHCGQFIVREGAQRPGIKSYIYIYVYIQISPHHKHGSTSTFFIIILAIRQCVA